MKKIIFIILLLTQLSIFASEEKISLEKAPIDLTNQSSLQRGAKTFINYCLNCHSAKYMRYNKLMDIGLSKKNIEVAKFAAKLLKIKSLHAVPILKFKNKMIKQFYKDSKKVSNKNMKRTLMIKLKYPTFKHGLRNIFNNFM